ncbi:MAG: PIN domain-containing protein [Gammaproteobacteria bacterium]|nr:PIN domain-containing protein [Gammaproteobacteria bacterium]
MILIDSSSWIHLLRPKGDPAVRTRVENALQSGEACWCPLIQLELWNGAGGHQEKKVLREFALALPELPITDGVWRTAYDLARRARECGTTIPASDLVIAACAKFHGTGLETSDSDFARLENVIVEL